MTTEENLKAEIATAIGSIIFMRTKPKEFSAAVNRIFAWHKEHTELAHLSGQRIGKQVIREGVVGLRHELGQEEILDGTNRESYKEGWNAAIQAVINLIDDNLSNKL